MRRRLRSALPLLPLAVAACTTGDDARTAFGASVAEAPPDELPVLQNTRLPFHYPPELFVRQVEANVVLRLYIDSLGVVRPESTAVAEPSGHAALDSAAMTGARQLRFAPARRAGRPVGVSVKFPILFRHPNASGANGGAASDTSGARGAPGEARGTGG